jgi:hypothetical protein
MGQSYEKNKVHIYKWRENNKERSKEIMRKYANKNYKFIKETIRLRKINI